MELIYTRETSSNGATDSAVTHNQFVANSRLKTVSAAGGGGGGGGAKKKKKKKNPHSFER